MAGHFIATTDCGKEIHILMFYSVHLPTKVSSFESSPLHPSPAAAAVACISLAADIVNDTKSFSAQENCKLLNHYKMSQVLEIWVRGFFWRRVQVGPSPASSKRTSYKRVIHLVVPVTVIWTWPSWIYVSSNNNNVMGVWLGDRTGLKATRLLCVPICRYVISESAILL